MIAQKYVYIRTRVKFLYHGTLRATVSRISGVAFILVRKKFSKKMVRNSCICMQKKGKNGAIYKMHKKRAPMGIFFFFCRNFSKTLAKIIKKMYNDLKDKMVNI